MKEFEHVIKHLASSEEGKQILSVGQVMSLCEFMLFSNNNNKEKNILAEELSKQKVGEVDKRCINMVLTSVIPKAKEDGLLIIKNNKVILTVVGEEVAKMYHSMLQGE